MTWLKAQTTSIVSYFRFNNCGFKHLTLLCLFGFAFNANSIISLSSILQCTKSCGFGIKQRYVSCRYKGGEEAPSNLCHADSEPDSVMRCSERSSCPQWKTEAWSMVRKNCLSRLPPGSPKFIEERCTPLCQLCANYVLTVFQLCANCVPTLCQLCANYVPTLSIEIYYSSQTMCISFAYIFPNF